MILVPPRVVLVWQCLRRIWTEKGTGRAILIRLARWVLGRLENHNNPTGETEMREDKYSTVGTMWDEATDHPDIAEAVANKEDRTALEREGESYLAAASLLIQECGRDGIVAAQALLSSAADAFYFADEYR